MKNFRNLVFLVAVTVAVIGVRTKAQQCNSYPSPECDCIYGAESEDVYCDFFPSECDGQFCVDAWEKCEQDVPYNYYLSDTGCSGSGYYCEAWCFWRPL